MRKKDKPQVTQRHGDLFYRSSHSFEGVLISVGVVLNPWEHYQVRSSPYCPFQVTPNRWSSNHSGLVLKATTTPLQNSRSTPQARKLPGRTPSRLGAKDPRVTKSMVKKSCGNTNQFGGSVDWALVSQIPKDQQVWVEDLRVLSKKVF